MVLVMAAAGAGFLAATALLVDGSPGAGLGLLLGNATVFVAFLNVLSLALLFVGIGGFVTLGHGTCGEVSRILHSVGAAGVTRIAF